MIDDKASYIVVIENLLSGDECRELIEYIDCSNPSPAPINTVDGVKRDADVRNNDRAMMNDEKFALKIFNRAKTKIPPSICNSEVIGLNELFRCYRYQPGMKFAPHTDGAYQRNDDERSFYTFLIYLNEVEEGGETNFLVEPALAIEPKPGLGVVFQHPITHEGAIVLKGKKYVLRSDVMYRRKA
jgi:hypothetical protein